MENKIVKGKLHILYGNSVYNDAHSELLHGVKETNIKNILGKRCRMNILRYGFSPIIKNK